MPRGTRGPQARPSFSELAGGTPVSGPGVRTRRRSAPGPGEAGEHGKRRERSDAACRVLAEARSAASPSCPLPAFQ